VLVIYFRIPQVLGIRFYSQQKSLECTKNILAEGACMMVGNGDNILVWEDPWIPDCPSLLPKAKEGSHPENFLVVSQLFTQNKMNWDVNMLRNIFDEDTVSAIQNIPLVSSAQEDRWVWTRTTTVNFIVKFALGVSNGWVINGLGP
jgi:hypothetical protein